MIDQKHELPLTRQSQILELSRSSLYYRAVAVSDRDLQMMRIIDPINSSCKSPERVKSMITLRKS